MSCFFHENVTTSILDLHSDGTKVMGRGGISSLMSDALLPQVERKKKKQKSAIFCKFFDFCSLRETHFAPSMPPQKNFWCRH